MIGHAIEPEHLVEADAQEDLHERFLRARGGFAPDEPVERAFPADDAIDDFEQQAAIVRSELRGGWLAFDEVFREFPAVRAALEDAGGNFSWFPFVHCLILRVTLAPASLLQTMREELERLVAAERIQRQHVDPLMILAKGGYCHHKSWGFGRITTMDTVLGRLIIDFQTKSAHAMDLSFAAESLKPISSEHILARKASDLAGLRKTAALNHLDLIKIVLQSFGGKATQDQIMGVLVPDVIADDWKKWWEAAKREMKKDGHFQVPLKKSEPIIYQASEMPLQERLLQEFRAAKGLKARLTVAGEILKNAADLADAATVAGEVLPALNTEISSHQKNHPSLALEAIFVRDDLRDTAKAKTQDGEVTTHAILANHSRPGPLIEAIPAAKHKRALQHFKEANPDTWVASVLGIINSVSAKLCGECADLLMDSGKLEQLKETLARLISQHQASSELLLWLAKERSDAFADILGPEVFRAMLTAMERDAFNERKSNRLRDYILADQSLLVELIGSADIEIIRDLTRALQLSPSFDDMDKRSLLGRIVKSFPGIQSMISGEQTKQEVGLIVSWTSLERRKNEYEELCKKKIPANSKEIAIARSYGDLRENHEYKAAKEMQKLLMRRKAELEAQLLRARGTDFANLKPDQIGVGSKVKVTDLNAKHSETYSILGAWDYDPENNVISYLTPMAQALLNHKVGDVVDFEMDSVKKHYRVEEIGAAVVPTSAAPEAPEI
jgi:transcription elongation factor GreA